MSEGRCAAVVYDDQARWHRCTNKATQGEYCGIHSLEAITMREEMKPLEVKADEKTGSI